MAGQQVGCIVDDGKINVQAFIEKAKAEKLVAERETVSDKGQKYVSLHKQG